MLILKIEVDIEVWTYTAYESEDLKLLVKLMLDNCS